MKLPYLELLELEVILQNLGKDFMDSRGLFGINLSGGLRDQRAQIKLVRGRTNQRSQRDHIADRFFAFIPAHTPIALFDPPSNQPFAAVVGTIHILIFAPLIQR